MGKRGVRIGTSGRSLPATVRAVSGTRVEYINPEGYPDKSDTLFYPVSSFRLSAKI